MVYQWVAEKDNHNSCTRSRPFPVTSNHQYKLIPNIITYKYKLIQIHPYKVVYCRHMSHSLPRVSESSNSSLHPMVQPCRFTTEKSMSADPSSALQDRHLDHMHDCRSLNHPPSPPNQVAQYTDSPRRRMKEFLVQFIQVWLTDLRVKMSYTTFKQSCEICS